MDNLPNADDLEFMLSLRRQGIETSWEHNGLLDALMGNQGGGLGTSEDTSQWSYLKPDSSLGTWRPPANAQEGALFNVVRDHEALVANANTEAETGAQTQAQSQANLEAIATAAPEVPPQPDLQGLAADAQYRQSTLRRASGASGSPMGIVEASKVTGRALRSQRTPRSIVRSFLQRD